MRALQNVRSIGAGVHMGVVESVFTVIGTWFGYVGACFVAPDATCRPFLAFLALCAAASAALTLVLMANRAENGRETTHLGQDKAATLNAEVQERPRATIAARQTPAQPRLQRRLRAAA